MTIPGFQMSAMSAIDARPVPALLWMSAIFPPVLLRFSALLSLLHLLQPPPGVEDLRAVPGQRRFLDLQRLLQQADGCVWTLGDRLGVGEADQGLRQFEAFGLRILDPRVAAPDGQGFLEKLRGPRGVPGLVIEDSQPIESFRQRRMVR